MSKIAEARARIEARANGEPAGPTPVAPVQTTISRVRDRIEAAQVRPSPTQQPQTAGRTAALGAAKTERERFAEAVESLHGLSIAEKVERKRSLVEQYRATVEGLLAAGAPREKLFTWWVLWLYDVGAIEQFIPRARQAIAYDWLTDINRDLRTYLYDSVLEWALGEAEAGRSPEPYFGQFYPGELKHMIEVVQAKYHKFAGDQAATQARVTGSVELQVLGLQDAIEKWRKAHKVYAKAGVKTRIAETIRTLKKLGVEVPPEQDSTPTEGDTD